MAWSLGLPFLLDKAAGDLARGVHPRLDVHRQGEEVHVALGGGHHCRHQHHRVARADHHGAARLLGQPARLEGDESCRLRVTSVVLTPLATCLYSRLGPPWSPCPPILSSLPLLSDCYRPSYLRSPRSLTTVR